MTNKKPLWLKRFLAEFFKLDSERRTRADRELSKLTMVDLETLIDLELRGRASFSVLCKLHQRYCSQRTITERDRLKQFSKTWRISK